MTQLFSTFLIVNALAIIGVYMAFQPGNILSNWGVTVEQIVGKTWVRPLFSCPTCMASVHGAIGFATWFIACGCAPLLILPALIAYIFALSGLSTIFSEMI